VTEDDRQREGARLLAECLSWAAEHEETAEARFNVDAFETMQRTVNAGRLLSDPRLKWIRDVHEKLFEEPQYENAWSAGKIPRGEKLATPVPEVLKRPLPMKPPPRKVEE